MEYDTVCSMYKDKHRHKHFGVDLLCSPRDELVWFFEGEQSLLLPQEDSATVPHLLADNLIFFSIIILLPKSFLFLYNFQSSLLSFLSPNFQILKAQNNDGNEQL